MDDGVCPSPRAESCNRDASVDDNIGILGDALVVEGCEIRVLGKEVRWSKPCEDTVGMVEEGEMC